MATRKNVAVNNQRVLIVNGKGLGTFRIYIPSDAKITFGPIVPTKGRFDDGLGMGTCLRIYQGTSQIALFKDVHSFRDSTLKIERLMTRKKGSQSWETSEKQSNFKSNEEREYSWELVDEGCE